jgi:hypothetical protein
MFVKSRFATTNCAKLDIVAARRENLAGSAKTGQFFP